MSLLPSGWVEATIGDVTAPIQTRDPASHPDAEFSYVDIGSIDNKRQVITEPKKILGRDAPSRARRIIREGDILFSTVRTYLKNIAIVPPELDDEITSTGIAVLRPNEAVDGRFLFNWVTSDTFVTVMSKAQDGTLYPAVTDRDVFTGPMPLPPVQEQRRIATKIDGLTSRTARVRADLDRIPTLVARYRQRLLSLAFSGELTAAWRTAHGVPSAELVPLRTLCLTLTDGDHQAPPKTSSGIPFITISAMNDGRIDLSKATRMVPKSYFENLKPARRPEQGDILFSVTGSIGIAALVESNEPFVFQRHIAILKPDVTKVDARYLCLTLTSPEVKEQTNAVATGTAQLTVPLGGLREFKVPLPDRSEQIEIVRLVESAFSWLARIEADQAAASRLLPKLDVAILAKAFRGELVPQDPRDEPASAVLGRVRSQRGKPTRRAGAGSTLSKAGDGVVAGISALPDPIVHIPMVLDEREVSVIKSRHDPDVMGQPYLSSILRKSLASWDIERLFKASNLSVADFYKQLAWEIASGFIRDSQEVLEAA